jgi:class 3 adenylate cyclase
VSVCPGCGFENAADAKFCSQCGTPLATAGERREERKVVTVLFCDLVGFTSRAEQLDPEDVRALLSSYHAHVRTELEALAGTVEKFVGDAVMAVFGAPVAHEDDPERAVRAALAIRDWAREQEGLQVRVAVNTGEALVSLGARPEAGEALVAGDVVNTAARLQAAAPVNAILVGEVTRRATERAIEYRDVAPVEAKGKAAPLAAWEAVEARARVGVELVGRTVPLVGREQELELLAGALRRVRGERAPQLVTIVGVPGIGKSRLVAELFRIVERDPELIYWRRGRSLPYGESTPLFAFAEMVKAQAGILDTDPAGEAEEKLRRATVELLGDEADWVTERLRPLAGLEAGIAGGDARAQSFAAWRQLVEGLAERSPTVLVFEDLHWADDDLLDFVDHIVDWATDVQLLVVATARPELLERRPGWGGGKRNALTISLGPLDETETARLLAGLLGKALLAAETQSALLAAAAGNPLYAEQFAAMVAERGDALAVPENVQGIIAARLDALAPEEKRLLQAAAVLGRQFWLGAVVAVDGAAHTEAVERLHALQRKEFVRRERRSSVAGETEFTFAHLLVRDVAYGQIPRGQRIEKHRAAAEWIESLAPDRSEDRADMLAHHYLAALELAEATGGDSAAFAEPARRALRDAADRALSLGAFRAAARLYGQALDLWPADDAERPFAVLRQSEAIFYALGRPDAEALLQAGAKLAQRGERALGAKAEILAAVTFWWEGKRNETDRHAARAVELVHDLPPSAEKATVLAERARLLMVEARAEESLAIGREALEMAERLGLDNIAASVLVTMGAARATYQGDADAGASELERGIELAVRAKAVQQIQRGHVNLAELRWHQGHLSEAAAHYRAARPFGEQYGDPYGLRWLDTADCEMDYLAGAWASAEAGATAFIDEVEAGSPYYTENTARSVRAEIRWARGDARGAFDDAEAGLRQARQAHDAQTLGPSLVTLARLLVHERREAESAPLVEELLALEGEHGGFAYFGWIADSAWLARDTGLLEAWRERAAREPASPFLEIGEAIAHGDDAAAAELFEAKGHVTEAAYAHLRAAEALAGAGRRAEAEPHARAAIDFYGPVGATAYVRRAEALLAVSA